MLKLRREMGSLISADLEPDMQPEATKSLRILNKVVVSY